MNSYFTKAMLAAVVAGVTTVANAAPMYLDGSAKVRGDYGWSSGNSSPSATVYRSVTPTTRSFSYEPSKSIVSQAPKVENKADAGKKVETAKKNVPSTTARTETRSTRSYSYEPGMNSSRTMSSGGSSRTPSYMLPNSDPRKYSSMWK